MYMCVCVCVCVSIFQCYSLYCLLLVFCFSRSEAWVSNEAFSVYIRPMKIFCPLSQFKKGIITILF